MEAVIAFSLLLGQICTAYILFSIMKMKQEDADRIVTLAESAMDKLLAKSLEESVRVANTRKSFDMQVEYLRDTHAKEAQMLEERKKQPVVPQRVQATSDAGVPQTIDLNEFEIFS
jgi:folate-binding Fe-S cluster repair protein YgfZ